MLVKIRISPNEIVILQYIAEEVDSFWVVPVGHAHCRVTWPKIWFQDWKISFLGCFKVASWPVLPRLFFLKINSANWLCQNNRGSQGDNEKGVGQGCWGGRGRGVWSTQLKQKVGCFSYNNLGSKGGQEKFHYNLAITAIMVGTKSCLGRHIWQFDQKNRRQWWYSKCFPSNH